MTTAARLLLTSLFMLTALQALAADKSAHFDISLSTLADNASGRSVDLNAVFTPNARFSIGLGAGSSDAGTSVSTLHGKSLNGNVDVHLGSFGVRPSFSRWNDDEGFTSATPQLSAYWKKNALRLQLQAERPKFSLEYQIGVGTQTTLRRFEFGGNGVGGGMDYYGDHWGGYANFMSYSYGNEVTRARAILQLPNLQDFPRLALLASSVATLTNGALKDRSSAGLEYAFTRASIHADVSRITDAIYETNSDSVSLGLNYLVSSRFSVDLSGGISHAQGFKDTQYASLLLGLHW
jgi:hypothetical protein